MPNVLNLKKLKKEKAFGERKDPSSPAKDFRTTEAYISWEAPEYERHPKKSIWFFLLALATLSFAAAAFYYGNYLFIFFILTAGIMVGWFGIKEPRVMRFSITSDGIRLDNRIYLFDDLNSFCIFYEPPLFKELSIESKKIFMPDIKVPLGDADPDKIRETLLRFLPEKKHNESLIDILLRLVRF